MDRAARNAQLVRNPVRSGKGSYLRSPFELNSSFSEQAAKYVLAGGAGNAAARRVVDGEPEEAKARRWARAGVGAEQLTQRERQLQVDESRKLYGDLMPAAGSSGNNDGGSGGDASAGRATQVNKLHHMGVTSDDQQILKKIARPSLAQARQSTKRQRTQMEADDVGDAETEEEPQRPQQRPTQQPHQHPQEQQQQQSRVSAAPKPPLSKAKRLEQARLAALFGKKKGMKKH